MEPLLISDSTLTIVGTVVTLVGTGVTVWQASKAREYKEQIKFDVRKINLASVSERLKRAQEEIRRLPTSSQSTARGVRPNELIKNTREHFDVALGTLDANGPDASARTKLVAAQNNLNSYELSWNAGDVKPQCAHELQAQVQDVISILGSTIFKLEGKA